MPLPQTANRDLQALLQGSSRTFALAIPSLPEPTRKSATVAYLLCRILDTVEDAPDWPLERRVATLFELEQLMEQPGHTRAAQLARQLIDGRVSRHPGCQRLVADLPRVLATYQQLPDAVRPLVGGHARRMAKGMIGFLSIARARAEFRLCHLAELREYCYVVAGIAGELLTELFLVDHPSLVIVSDELRRRAALFGEGLQLVNVLRDATADAREGRYLLPAEVDLADVVALAREALAVADEYVRILERAAASPGLVAFAAFPVRLAQATLECVLRDGPGAKVSRAHVAAICTELGITSSGVAVGRG